MSRFVAMFQKLAAEVETSSPVRYFLLFNIFAVKINGKMMKIAQFRCDQSIFSKMTIHFSLHPMSLSLLVFSFTKVVVPSHLLPLPSIIPTSSERIFSDQRSSSEPTTSSVYFPPNHNPAPSNYRILLLIILSVDGSRSYLIFLSLVSSFPFSVLLSRWMYWGSRDESRR